MLGFETIGNAILTVFDSEPLLACDPWLQSGAYFGSWALSHQIPSEQADAIRRCRYLWISHGHPDHLDLASLDRLSNKTILLADHVGSRLARDLRSQGFSVQTLPDRTWVDISKRVRILSIADYNQDSILLIQVGERLVINLNDASDRGWSGFVRQTARRFSDSYLLRISTLGDADMVNFFNEDGQRIAPSPAPRAYLGRRLAQYADLCGAKYAIPFSSFHQYQRSDSVWANRFCASTDAFGDGFTSSSAELLPPFVRVHCDRAAVDEIRPRPINCAPLPPSTFGDIWSDPLERAEVALAKDYFQRKQRLKSRFGFVRLRVGGKEHLFDLNPQRAHRGITFEAPRRSLTLAIENRVFDDLLIGNFMKATLHGGAALYPHFTPFVAKYADNGGAETEKQLRIYMNHYLRRSPVAMLSHLLECKSELVVRALFRSNKKLERFTKRVYWAMRG